MIKYEEGDDIYVYHLDGNFRYRAKIRKIMMWTYSPTWYFVEPYTLADDKLGEHVVIIFGDKHIKPGNKHE